MKTSILVYIIAGTLAVTGVAAGVAIVANTNKTATQEANCSGGNGTDEEGNANNLDERINSETVSSEDELEGAFSKESLNNSGKSTGNNENKEKAIETETPTEIAEELVEMEGATIEGKISVEDVVDAEERANHSSNANTSARTAQSNTAQADEDAKSGEDSKEAEIKKEQEQQESINAKMNELQESLRAKYEAEWNNIKETGSGNGEAS